MDDTTVSSRKAVQTPLVEPGHTFTSVTDKISSIVLTKTAPFPWYIGAGVGFLLTMMLFFVLFQKRDRP